MEPFLNPGLPGYYYRASACKKRKTEKNTPWCSHLFPVFSSANCSCLSISVKPPVHVSSHPDDRFPQSTCSCLLRSNLESPSLASRYIFKVQADEQVCTALQKTHFLSFCHVLYLPVSDPSLALRLSFSVVIASLCPTPTTKKPLLSL